MHMSTPALLQELSQLKSWSFEGMLETGMTSIFGSSWAKLSFSFKTERVMQAGFIIITGIYYFCRL